VTDPDFVRATRSSYDAVAAGYAERFRDELVPRPLDRAMLAAFAEFVQAAGGGPVVDVGCGAGPVTALLAGLGLQVSGIDLSPQMIATARRDHPGLRFEVGSMLALDLPDGTLGGVLAWYSTIHVPDDRLPGVFAEFRRVLAPGGYVLLGFQVGDEPVHMTEALGQPVSLNFHRRQPEQVAGLLGQAGLAVSARLVREPDDVPEFPEEEPQAFLLARKHPPDRRSGPGLPA
jgi:SAM-dependent methyltransferase